MYSRSSLSDVDRVAAVALFVDSYGSEAVASLLGVGKKAVAHLYDRWRIRGSGALVAKRTKRMFSFEEKLAVVQRFLAGESKIDIARDEDLSSVKLIEDWLRVYRREGESGLRPKPRGRPRASTAAARQELSELDRLRQENERLRAEVAYLGKLRALRAQKRQ